jgi:hypothetical protein
MTISNSLEQNLANIPRLLLIVKTLAHDPIKQFSPFHLLGNEVIIRWFLVDIVKTNNVFVFQFLEDINFILEGDLVFFGEFGFGNNFDGVVFVGSAFGGFDDYGEGSFTELL